MSKDILLGGGRVTQKIGWEIGRHRDRGLEFVFLEKGHQSWEVAGEQYHLEAPAVMWELPWQEHRTMESSPCDLYYIIIALRGGNTSARCTFPKAISLGKGDKPFVKRLVSGRQVLPANIKRVGSLIRNIAEESSEGFVYSKQIIEQSIRLLFFEIMRGLDTPPDDVPVEGNDSTERVRIFLKSLIRRSDTELSLEEMAAECHLNRSRFSELVKLISGMTPFNYLNRVKCEKAAAELLYTEKSITEVALANGFQNSQYFSRIFKQYFGCTPGDYRRQRS